MKLLATLPIFCLLALASALDSPQRCTSPDQMEGMVSVFHPVNFVDNYGNFSYDAINKRFYKSVFVFRGGHQQWKQVDILLFQESVMYRYFPHNGTCLKSSLRAPFRKFGVPKDATFIGQVYIGSVDIPKAGVRTNVWSGAEDNVKYMMTFTDVKCLPQFRAKFQEDHWFSESFTDLVLGIRDPTVFTPPPECDDPVYEPSLSERLHPWVAISVSGVNASGVDQFLDISGTGGNL
ncbi:ependymin-like [Hypanus sabinus]|uniref:ependymin-like n=1 Tax=Hypanus sabinus TaxID=79690 RepID=UPI0028C47149|nr:ependymin-like [Hypanus sabinus]